MVHLILVNRSRIHPLVGTCLWHVKPACANVHNTKAITHAKGMSLQVGESIVMEKC